MKNKTYDEETDEFSIPLPSSLDLRGKQSVRATFKLSERAIDAISIVAVHLGIKQKSLFDHLIEDVQSMNLIARKIRQEKTEHLNRVQKTYVLSRNALTCLCRISEDFNAPRDALVEYSIQRLLPIITRERKKHQLRKEILADMEKHLKQGEKILAKSRAHLGEDDPVFDRLKNAMKGYRNSYSAVHEFVEKGKIIEDF